MSGATFNARELWRAQTQNWQAVRSRPNEWNLYLEAAAFGFLNGIAMAFLTVFAVRLGASNAMVGILTAGPQLVNFLWMVPAARLIERVPERRRLMIIAGVSSRVFWLFIALVPFFVPHEWQPLAIVILVLILTAPGSLLGVAWTVNFGEIMPIESRARVMSTRLVMMSLTTMLAQVVGGWFLELVSLPLNYQLLFAFGSVMAMVSVYYLTRLQVPPGKPAAPTPATEGERKRPLRRFVNVRHVIARHPDFAKFMLCSFTYHWGLFLPFAVVPIYLVRYIGASDFWIGIISSAGTLATMVAYPWWGRYATRHGNRRGLVVSTFGLTCFTAVIGFLGVPWPVVILQIVTGLFAAGVNLTFFNGVLEVCPANSRPTYIAAHASMVGMVGFVGPLLGTAMLDTVGPLAVFLVATGFRVAGAYLFHRLPTRVAAGA